MAASTLRRNLHVLAINAFHGGSHRQFLSSVLRLSRHRWTLVEGKPVHWKWRMRSAPLELSIAASESVSTVGNPDVIFCTDMLDLPTWRGLMRSRIQQTPTAIYFHENQWTYPIAAHSRPDAHFGYTNLLSAIASDACWFNSQFHLRDFLQASESFIRRMPDARAIHDLDALSTKCKVIYPGFDPMRIADDGCSNSLASAHDSDSVLRIGWVSRWEQDKRPDRFADLLDLLNAEGIAFKLLLLGPRPKAGSIDHARIIKQYGDQVEYDGFAARDEYERQLQKMDVVVSTADHEFFGIAICEAIWAGAVPILPNRLSYPELVPTVCLYDDLPSALCMIQSCMNPSRRRALSSQCRAFIAPMQTDKVVQELDDSIDVLFAESH